MVALPPGSEIEWSHAPAGWAGILRDFFAELAVLDPRAVSRRIKSDMGWAGCLRRLDGQRRQRYGRPVPSPPRPFVPEMRCVRKPGENVHCRNLGSWLTTACDEHAIAGLQVEQVLFRVRDE